jgi:hypothetical protein
MREISMELGNWEAVRIVRSHYFMVYFIRIAAMLCNSLEQVGTERQVFASASSRSAFSECVPY